MGLTAHIHKTTFLWVFFCCYTLSLTFTCIFFNYTYTFIYNLKKDWKDESVARSFLNILSKVPSFTQNNFFSFACLPACRIHLCVYVIHRKKERKKLCAWVNHKRKQQHQPTKWKRKHSPCRLFNSNFKIHICVRWWWRSYTHLLNTQKLFFLLMCSIMYAEPAIQKWVRWGRRMIEERKKSFFILFIRSCFMLAPAIVEVLRIHNICLLVACISSSSSYTYDSAGF